jgi:hypothetical protein
VKNSFRPYSGLIADLLVCKDRPMYLIAADDTHYYDEDAAVASIMVECDSLDREDVMRAIKNGDFYATTGPEVHIEVKNGETVKITDDGLEEGLYRGADLENAVLPKLLMDKSMDHMAYYLAGKAVKRTLVTPLQLNVSEKISLGEDLCCVFPCYLHAESVYVSKKAAYLYTVRTDSMSKEFNTNQIGLIENVISELSRNDTQKLPDIEAQLCRYSAFMCFAISASAAEGGHFKSLKTLKKNILASSHRARIAAAEFENISPKSRITVALMKKERYALAFYFLYLCGIIKKILGR